jgi:hypothetical protein
MYRTDEALRKEVLIFFVAGEAVPFGAQVLVM